MGGALHKDTDDNGAGGRLGDGVQSFELAIDQSDSNDWSRAVPFGRFVQSDSNGSPAQDQSDSNGSVSDSNDVRQRLLLGVQLGDMRIEFFSKKGKNGQVWLYFQFAARNTKQRGTRGGKKLRLYGGNWNALENEERKAAYRENKVKKHQRLRGRQEENADVYGDDSGEIHNVSESDSNSE